MGLYSESHLQNPQCGPVCVGRVSDLTLDENKYSVSAVCRQIQREAELKSSNRRAVIGDGHHGNDAGH